MVEPKIAAILPEHSIHPDTYVINKGTNDGVRLYMHFKVFEPRQEIKDPDTKKVIGEVQRQTGLLYVREVRERIAICAPIIDDARDYVISMAVGHICREVEDTRGEEDMHKRAAAKSS